MLEEYTIEEQRSVVRILWVKGLNVKDIHKEMFPVYGDKYLSRKSVRKSQMMPNLVRMLLRQRSEDFALLKGWDKCIKVGWGYVEK
jgi:hypothetical protein